MKVDSYPGSPEVPAIVTYDDGGTIRQISHLSRESMARGLTTADVVGSHVSEWGDAMESLGQHLLSRADATLRDVAWTHRDTRQDAVTRCLFFRLHRSARVAIMTMRRRHFDLTPQELDILSRVADGHSQAQIADAVHLTEAAVKSTLVRVREKTGARTTAHAVAIAVRCGLI